MTEKRRRRRVPVLAAALAALALAAAHLLDCIPGIGVGGDPVSGPSIPEETKNDEEVAPSVNAREVIVVRGADCTSNGKEPSACADVCRALRSEAEPTHPVEVDATHGSHEAVEELVRCLSDAGFSNVQVRSE